MVRVCVDGNPVAVGSAKKDGFFSVTLDTALTSGQKVVAQQIKDENNAQFGLPNEPPMAVGSDATSYIQDTAKNFKDIQKALATQDPDFALVLGVASLIVRPTSADYENQSNVIHTTNLGRATPQLLTGISFRTKIPSLFGRYRSRPQCKPDENSEENRCAELWQKRPWNAFLSLKLAPGASQTLSGFVFGGSYAIAHHLDLLLGIALTPINEPAPGFRIAAANYVRDQQKQGQYLNFNPDNMSANAPAAFDGFPVTDPAGRLIYQGNPLTVHYRAGAIFGVSIPIYFNSIWK